MYQAGEVDFLVATDAIGMGLNMDVNHVAFAAIRKFDGDGPRHLTPAEVGQIAGRAGRHLNDGTFGTTAELDGLAPDLVAQVESHRFDPVSRARWRNARLRFDSVAGLLRALEAPPAEDCLIRAREADDYLALAALARDPEIAALARGPDRVRLLWQVCQIPDFRKTMAQTHAELLGRIFRHLAQAPFVLPADWVARQVSRLEHTEGDIDTLAGRLAHIRTWTYVSHRPDWLKDAGHWQERTRAIEDKLSDALHARLTQRFVDRRTAVLVRRLNDRSALSARIEDGGEVMVEGEYVGRLDGLRFAPDPTAGGLEGRALRAAASRGLAGEIGRRAGRLGQEDQAAIHLRDDGRLWWEGAPVAILLSGDAPLRPRLRLLAEETLGAPLRERVERRLDAWLKTHLETGLAPLFRLARAELEGTLRGLAFQLFEGLGIVSRRAALAPLGPLPQAEQKRLARLGVTMGELDLYLPSRLKPAAARLCCLLWAIHAGEPQRLPPAPGTVSLAADSDLPPGYWQAAGYRVFAGRAVRVDMVERLAAAARRRAEAGPFPPDAALQALVGCPAEPLAALLRALGYRATPGPEGLLYHRPKRRRPATAAAARREQAGDAASPFAKLRQISRP